MAGVEDDDNVTFAVLLYAHIIARGEEDKQQQPGQPQPQAQRASSVCDHGLHAEDKTTAWPVLQPQRHPMGLEDPVAFKTTQG